ILTIRASCGRAVEDTRPYAVFARPPLTSIIKVKFRTAVAVGHTLAAAARDGFGRRPEGEGGNACASRAWKGNGWPDIRLLVSFLGFAESNIIGLTGLCKSSWPAANAYSDRQIRLTDYPSTDFDP